MQKKFFLGLSFFIFTTIAFPGSLHANFVEEKEISTKDGSIIRSGTVMLEKIEIQEEEK